MKSTLTLLLLLFVGAFSSHLSCPPGYTMVLEKCLRVIQTPLTHSQAEYNCTYEGGTLFGADSAIETRAVSRFASKSGINLTWFGLFCYDTNPTNCIYDLTGKIAAFYDNFATGYPLVDGNYGGCVYMNTSDGKWFSTKCETINMPGICEVPVIRHVSPLSCQNAYDRFCYLPMLETTGIFSEAQKVCESQNGNLVSIHAKAELDYVKSIFRRQPTAGNVYIGAQLVYENTYEWVDGSGPMYDFDYRDPRENGTSQCLSMNVTSGLWNGVSCDTSLNFLCKVLIGPDDLETKFKGINQDDIFDDSFCNITRLHVPGTFTSYYYRLNSTTKPDVYCTWKIVGLGPWRIWFFFTDVNVYNPIYIYDEDGNQVNAIRKPTTYVSKTNIASVSFKASGIEGYAGFKAVTLQF